MSIAVYHERQRLMHCAMHALNNLFQEPWVDRDLMERLALELCNREATLRSESGMGRLWINPFKSSVPLLGDYDINVVLEALKLKECRVSVHVVFNPKDPRAFEIALAEAALEDPSVRGIIVNFVCRNLLWGAWVSHHFYAIVKGPATLGVSDAATGTGGEPTAEVTGAGGGAGERASEKVDEMTRACLGQAPRRSAGLANERPRQWAGTGRGNGGSAAAPENDTGGNSNEAVGRKAGTHEWYSLDSRLPKPRRLGGAEGLMAHLAWEVREHHGHVFVVCDGREEGCNDDLDLGNEATAV